VGSPEYDYKLFIFYDDKMGKTKQYKTSKVMGIKPDFYLCIIKHINKSNSLPVLPITKQAMNYYVSKLKRRGIIKKIGYGTWMVNEKEVKDLDIEQVKMLGSDGKNIRGHGFHFRIRLPNLRNWNKRTDYLIKNNISFVSSNASWEGQRIMIKKCKVWLTNKSVVVYYPKGLDFNGASAKEGKKYALIHLDSIITSIESKLKVNLRYGGLHQVKICKQHYAKVKDSIAHEYNKAGKKVWGYVNEENWLVIDHSKGHAELETVHPVSADHDQDKVILPLLNGLKEHYDKTGESLTLNNMLQVIHAQQDQISQLSSAVESMIYKKPSKLNPRDSYFG